MFVISILVGVVISALLVVALKRSAVCRTADKHVFEPVAS